MGTMMKNDSDVVTIQIKGNGPIGAMTVTADSKGRVKGFVATTGKASVKRRKT